MNTPETVSRWGALLALDLVETCGSAREAENALSAVNLHKAAAGEYDGDVGGVTGEAALLLEDAQADEWKEGFIRP